MRLIEKVLIVDDEPDILTILKIFLKNKVNQVLTAKDGLEALEVLKENQVNLILSDISMPNMNGIDFLKQLRTTDNKTKFIFLSAYSQQKDDLMNSELNVLGFIQKPVTKKKILTVLDDILESKES
jgi:two-component system response regulator SaeR